MGRNVMLKELVARVALILFIISMPSEAAHDGENSGAAKRQPGPGVKNASASTPGEIAN
jgi:hypothetical protein